VASFKIRTTSIEKIVFEEFDRFKQRYSSIVTNIHYLWQHTHQLVAVDIDRDDDDDAERYEIPNNLAAYHTRRTAANYGVTIDMLRRLTDSLEIIGQVSHRWHKFLRLIGEPSSQPSRERKGAVDVIELTPLKRPKILPLEKPDLETGKTSSSRLRVVLVSAEAASSNGFLKWVTDLRVRGTLLPYSNSIVRRKTCFCLFH
jgi:hypothetical protein